jgi:hypothetical protein
MGTPLPNSRSCLGRELAEKRIAKKTKNPARRSSGRILSAQLEEARRTIEEYADDLREIIKKLRKHLH